MHITYNVSIHQKQHIFPSRAPFFYCIVKKLLTCSPVLHVHLYYLYTYLPVHRHAELGMHSTYLIHTFWTSETLNRDLSDPRSRLHEGASRSSLYTEIGRPSFSPHRAETRARKQTHGAHCYSPSTSRGILEYKIFSHSLRSHSGLSSSTRIRQTHTQRDIETSLDRRKRKTKTAQID